MLHGRETWALHVSWRAASVGRATEGWRGVCHDGTAATSPGDAAGKVIASTSLDGGIFRRAPCRNPLTREGGLAQHTRREFAGPDPKKLPRIGTSDGVKRPAGSLRDLMEVIVGCSQRVEASLEGSPWVRGQERPPQEAVRLSLWDFPPSKADHCSFLDRAFRNIERSLEDRMYGLDAFHEFLQDVSHLQPRGPNRHFRGKTGHHF